MDPNIWGTHAWLFLHTITLNYPDKPTKFDMDNYKKFFENLGEVIPCEVCKAHYKKNIKMNPIQLESKESLAKWLHHIHNLVNVKNHKPEYSYDQFIEKYSDLYSTNKNKKYLFIFLILISFGIIYYLYKK
jgi:FAD-linked sulfhydryl oxidase